MNLIILSGGDIMYLEQFMYFIEVANTKSMSVASNNLHVTQQNISRAIKQLETELGVTLFTRSKNGVFLTEDGQAAYGNILSILTSVETLKQKFIHNDLSEKEKKIYILSVYGLGHLQTEISQILIQKYPRYSFIIHEKEAPLINQELLSNNDYTIVTSQSDNLDDFMTSTLQEKYHAFLIKTSSLKLQVSIHNPIALQKSISLNVLSYLPFVSYCTDNNTPHFLEILRKRGVTITPTFSTNNTITSFSLMKEQGACALTTKYINMHIPKTFTNDLILIPLREKINIHYVLFLNKTNPEFAEISDLLNEVLKVRYEKLY